MSAVRIVPSRFTSYGSPFASFSVVSLIMPTVPLMDSLCCVVVYGKERLNKDLVVSVTADEDSGYYGTRRSFPYTTTQQRESIKGTVGIINETTDLYSDLLFSEYNSCR